jgi:pyruvate, water dikinase
MAYKYVNEFSAISFDDKLLVWNSNFFLGSAYLYFKEKNIRIPEGFVICSSGFNYYLEENKVKETITGLLSGLDRVKYSNIKDIGTAVRALILNNELPREIKNEIRDAKSALIYDMRSAMRLAVRSCMSERYLSLSNKKKIHDVFLNISDLDELYKAVLKCYASLFTDEEIIHREENNIDHFGLDMCIIVQKMVRSDLACSGIIKGIDPEEETDDIITIEGCWGMIENIVHQKVHPDLARVSRTKLWEEDQAIIHKETGEKEHTLLYYDWHDLSKEPTFVNIETLLTKRRKFVLTDSEILQLTAWSLSMSFFYNRKLEIVWAKDGLTNELYLVRLLSPR